MRYQYPQARHRDIEEKGEQPYTDAKESMSQTDAELQTGAEAYGEALRDESDEQLRTRNDAELAERLREVNREVSRKHHDQS